MNVRAAALLPQPSFRRARATSDDVAVRPVGASWHVQGPGLGNDLVFDRPDDAERLAIALARRRGAVARIFGANGRLLDSYDGLTLR